MTDQVIKLYHTHLAKVYLGEAVSSASLYRPSGVAATAPTAVADVADELYSVAFEPDEPGVWTLVVSGATNTVTRAMEARQTLLTEDAMGISQRPVELASIGGTAIPASQELSGTRGVCATPEWITRSWGGQISNFAITTSDHAYLNTAERTRVPYSDLITGFRMKANSPGLDLSGSTISMFQFVAFRKDGSSYYLRGRSENIDKSRIVASGDFFYFKLDRPIYARAGDYTGLRVQAGGTTSISHYTVLQEGVKTTATDGATNGTGLVLTSSGSTFITDGVEAGDTVVLYSSPYHEREVASVDSETQLTLTSATTASLSGESFQVGDSPLQSASSRETTAISDTGANGFDNAFSLQAIGSLPIDLIMNAPQIAVAGTSVEGGTDNDNNLTGTLHDSHTTVAYSQSVDIAEMIHQATGLTCVNAARGGSNLNHYIDTSARSYLGPQWSSVAAYRPGMILFSGIANDCTQSWASSGGRTALLDRLDKLLVEAGVIGSELAMMTGLPVTERNASQELVAQNHRIWTAEWASLNQTRLLETHRTFWQTSVTEDTENNWNNDDSVNGNAFPELATGSGNVHYEIAGYALYATTIARMLKSPTMGRQLDVVASQAEVQDAIEANHLDHLLAVDYDPASQPGVSTSLLNELVEDDGGVSRFTANAVSQVPSSSSTPAVTRALNEQASIEFSFPTDNVAAGLNANSTVSIDGGAAQSLNGSITQSDDIDGVKWYQLAYNAADRPTSVGGRAVYTFTDGSNSQTVILKVRDNLSSTQDANLTAIAADTNELQADWTNGGRLDLILDAILEDTGTTLNGLITTADGVIDAVKVVTDKLDDTLVADSSVWQFTANALELGTSSGLTQQQIADAMTVAPTIATPESGSLAAEMDTIVSRTAGGVTVTTTARQASDAGELYITRGSAYQTSDNYELSFVLSNYEGPLSGDGFSYELRILDYQSWLQDDDPTEVLSLTAATDAVASSTLTLTFDATATETGGLVSTAPPAIGGEANYRFQVWAVHTDADRTTQIGGGDVYVSKRIKSA